MNLSTIQNFKIIVLLACICNIHVVLCMLIPIASKTAIQAYTAIDIQGVPTPFSLIKRDAGSYQENLDLYQIWASMCREGRNQKNSGNNADQIDDTIDSQKNSPLNNLWTTVTQTVNCGGGHAVTVTKTVTASSTSKPNPTTISSGISCTGNCWSDYLWYTYGDSITPAQGFAGVVCIIIGLYFSILGFRFFRPTLSLVGFVFFAIMTWIGLVNNEPAGGYPLGDLIYICVSAGLGLLGAFILLFLYPLGVYCLAALGGFYFAVYFLSWKENLVITIKVARVCFIIGIGMLGPIALYFVETYMVLFCTALIGSYIFYFGLDFFAHTGFINPWLLIFDGDPLHVDTYLMSKPVYVMLAFVIVNTLISFGWQYYWNIYVRKSPGFGLAPLVEEKDPEKEKMSEDPLAQYVCMPPSYYQSQPMIMQNVCAPHYQA